MPCRYDDGDSEDLSEAEVESLLKAPPPSPGGPRPREPVAPSPAAPVIADGAREFCATVRTSNISPRTYFFGHLGACRRRTPTTFVDLKAPKDASHQYLSDATLRSDLALGARRRHAPKGGRK